VTDPSVVAVLLAEVPRSTVASPALLTERPAIVDLDDLASLPWLAVNSFYRNEVVLTHATSGEQRRFGIAPRLSTDSLYAARKAALEGLGVAIVSSWVVKEELAQGSLQTLLPLWRAEPLPIYLLYPYASYYPARLRKFMEMMKETMPRIIGAQPPTGR
jgi:DNA-binding transcriptional LysR family regulator